MASRILTPMLALLLAAAGGCEALEQALAPEEKGVYRGAEDPPLEPAQVERLRQRAVQQWR